MMESAMKTMSKELTAGDRVSDLFICAAKDVRTDKNGNKYLVLRLVNAQGVIQGKKWRVDDDFIETFNAQDCIRVDATVKEYQGKLELDLGDIQPVPDEDVDIAALLPARPGEKMEPEEMQESLAKVIDSLANPHLRALLDSLFRDEAFSDAFFKAPAAKGVHHNYIHGLAEHSLAVSRIADAVAGQYADQVNRDLLVTAGLLHDVGKIAEFNYTRAIEYSDQGRLLGHIILGEKLVSDAIDRLNEGGGAFPDELRLQLLHLVISHHGEREFGSPVEPHTLEGFILNHADNIDAKANIFMKLRAQAADSEAPWSEYHRLLERFLYLRKAEE
ncbi:MAG: HD domain-containing protein [Gaiellales bacterium]|nr:MAG: HD domain-containing protein [Gaiellales bacterium]